MGFLIPFQGRALPRSRPLSVKTTPTVVPSRSFSSCRPSRTQSAGHRDSFRRVERDDPPPLPRDHRPVPPCDESPPRDEPLLNDAADGAENSDVYLGRARSARRGREPEATPGHRVRRGRNRLLRQS
jgi:hypothetical protein